MRTPALSHEVAAAIERAEANAMVDTMRAAPLSFSEFYIDVDLYRIGSSHAFIMEEVDSPLFNRALCLGLDEPATEPMVDALHDLYRHTHMLYAVQLSPYAQPAAVHDWLEVRHILRNDRHPWVKFYRGVDPPPDTPTELRVVRVGARDAAQWAATAHVACGVHRALLLWTSLLVGRAGWHHYLAYDGDAAVACGALYVQDGVGWLGYGGTFRSQRRRGAQSAITAARIRDAAAMGCHLLTVETEPDRPEWPNPSYRNMLRMGFQIAYLRPNYRLDYHHDVQRTVSYLSGI